MADTRYIDLGYLRKLGTDGVVAEGKAELALLFMGKRPPMALVETGETGNRPPYALRIAGQEVCRLFEPQSGKCFANGKLGGKKGDEIGGVLLAGWLGAKASQCSLLIQEAGQYDPQGVDYRATVCISEEEQQGNGNGRREEQPRQQRGVSDSDAKPAPARAGGKAFDDDDNDPFADGR